MTSANKLFALCIVALVTCVHQTCAAANISCYAGTSTYIVQTNCINCQKSVISVPIVGNTVTKSCDTTGSCSQTAVGAFGVGAGTYCCNTDMCNEAGHIHMKFIGVLAAFLLAGFLMRR